MTPHPPPHARWSSIDPVPGWDSVAWRHPTCWPLVGLGAALTLVDASVITTAAALGHLPAIPSCAAFAALVALWARYLTRPIAGVTAHRPQDHQ